MKRKFYPQKDFRWLSGKSKSWLISVVINAINCYPLAHSKDGPFQRVAYELYFLLTSSDIVSRTNYLKALADTMLQSSACVNNCTTLCSDLPNLITNFNVVEELFYYMVEEINIR